MRLKRYQFLYCTIMFGGGHINKVCAMSAIKLRGTAVERCEGIMPVIEYLHMKLTCLK